MVDAYLYKVYTLSIHMNTGTDIYVHCEYIFTHIHTHIYTVYIYTVNTYTHMYSLYIYGRYICIHTSTHIYM